MARRSEPRFWESRDAWCVWLHGRQYTLAKGGGNYGAALVAFRRLRLQLAVARWRRDKETAAAEIAALTARDSHEHR